MILSQHRHASALATASLMDLISRAQAIQAATIRGAAPEEIEAMRKEAHDVVDAYLDRMAEAATFVRAIIEP